MTLENRSFIAIEGCLLGMAVADSIGLPYEGLSRARGQKLLPGPLRQRLLFGKGMYSDDTEHAIMVAQALLTSDNDVSAFTRALAWELRWWLLCLPAGAGMATLRACIKLWIGFPGQKSGVKSAGNGPAMRAPLLGILFADNPMLLRGHVRASTRLTHTDKRAEQGALLIALASMLSVKLSGNVSIDDYYQIVNDWHAMGVLTDDTQSLVNGVAEGLEHCSDDQEFANVSGLGKGVTGYINHTVSVVLFAWLESPTDYEKAVTSVVTCGGDTDTTAAIVGGIIGAAVGKDNIPRAWLDNMLEFPRGQRWISELAVELAKTEDGRPVPTNLVLLLSRNLAFITVVLVHGLRRLLPPY